MNNRRTKKRLNAVDFVIIILVIGCIAGVIARYNIVDRIVVNKYRDEVKISFKVSGISADIADNIKNGDTFYIDASSQELGDVISSEVSDARVLVPDENSSFSVTQDTSKKDVICTLKGFGIMGEDGFMLGGTEFLAPGDEVVIRSRQVQLSVIITEISSPS